MAEPAGRSSWVGNRVARLAAPILTVVAVVTVMGSIRASPTTSIEQRLPAWLVVLGLAGTASITIAAWMIREHRPSASAGLAVAGIALLAPIVAGWTWLPAEVRATSVSLTPAAIAGLGQVAIRWPAASGGHGQSAVRWLAGLAVLVLLLAYDPFEDPGCSRTCVDAAPVAGDLLSTAAAARIAALLSIVAVAVAVVAAARTIRLGAPNVLVGAIIAALVLLLGSAAAWILTGGVTTRDAVAEVAPGAGAAVLAGGATTLVAARINRARGAILRLVTGLSDPARVLADPGGVIRGVQFAVPGEDRWVDDHGRDVTPAAGTSVTIVDGAGPVARLAVATDADSDDVAAALTPATRLALRNEQLAAVARARLSDVQASRRRIVATSDAERERIERDLHDGAQQRLVGAALHLSLARARAPEADEDVRAAESSVRAALAHVRRLAHGPFPSVLATEGLVAALEELIRASDVPVTLEVRGSVAGSAETDRAAYAAVATALEQAAASRAGSTTARIHVGCEGERLRVMIAVPGAPDLPAFVDVADRVGAAGGELLIETTDKGMLVIAELRCASS